MDDRQCAILTRIEQAFAGVTLGAGVSLHESAVIDNYGSAEERRLAREPDEKDDWRKVVDDPDLTGYFGIAFCGLCFLDAEGFRFYLPACLSRGVKDHQQAAVRDMIWSLCCLLKVNRDDPPDHLALLNDAQKASVRQALLYLLEVLDENDEGLNRSLDGFWSLPAPSA